MKTGPTADTSSRCRTQVWGCDLRRGGADDFRDCMKDLQEQFAPEVYGPETAQHFLGCLSAFRRPSCVVVPVDKLADVVPSCFSVGPVTFDLMVMMVLDCTRDRQEWTVLGPPGWLLLWQKVARLTSWCYISTSGHQFQVLDTSVGPVTFDLVVMMVLDCTRDRQEQVDRSGAAWLVAPSAEGGQASCSLGLNLYKLTPGAGRKCGAVTFDLAVMILGCSLHLRSADQRRPNTSLDV
ncbi:hypothetical protein CRUP_017629 [Coryphaenoides rupestris]|nr:hypothetical protein CRUP_017629 [Coryphaenoides rupestris]